ncbi:A-kinase anchor protein inhibitor 1 [Terrapene carolina triunguis]|uniref:A-kinase anchor protein inhibitor 1 n=1 Tax=Terrapene triunguis TaxID=2587831 RepID=UPI0011562498|nr:A-kinase anchor protein inhibitor 1 [Terrapene carolina triunguis]
MLLIWTYNTKTLHCFPSGEKSGNEQEEVALQNASKQIVQTAILQAVQQVSQESQQKEKRVNSSVSLQLERGELTKKHEKK